MLPKCSMPGVKMKFKKGNSYNSSLTARSITVEEYKQPFVTLLPSVSHIITELLFSLLSFFPSW